MTLANKLLRICWAVWCYERRLSGDWQSARIPPNGGVEKLSDGSSGCGDHDLRDCLAPAARTTEWPGQCPEQAGYTNATALTTGSKKLFLTACGESPYAFVREIQF
ncbi:hypothetical protein CXK91_07405 [Stutzerimonas stutzeri]|uniref:Uncharacterized protein n=1 Tax=Stutzerimonas stutzeri TaxID=316 RepID=A0A2S4ASB9_STUST|nr:hypothetical protein CXK91_07405 [Stutzerimonas stutzeri]